MRNIFPALLILSFFAACNSPEPDPVILTDSRPQISVRNTVMFVYDEASCQLGFNSDKAEFRAHNDNMSEYVLVDLNRIPTSVGETVIAESLHWTNCNDVEIRKNSALKVLKIEDGTIWLWNSRESIAVVVRILE